MKKILQDILKELKYQTKLMEDNYHRRDQTVHDSAAAKQMLGQNFTALKKELFKHDLIKNNPELAASINNMMNIFN